MQSRLKHPSLSFPSSLSFSLTHSLLLFICRSLPDTYHISCILIIAYQRKFVLFVCAGAFAYAFGFGSLKKANNQQVVKTKRYRLLNGASARILFRMESNPSQITRFKWERTIWLSNCTSLSIVTILRMARDEYIHRLYMIALCVHFAHCTFSVRCTYQYSFDTFIKRIQG